MQQCWSPHLPISATTKCLTQASASPAGGFDAAAGLSALAFLSLLSSCCFVPKAPVIHTSVSPGCCGLYDSPFQPINGSSGWLLDGSAAAAGHQQVQQLQLVACLVTGGPGPTSTVGSSCSDCPCPPHLLMQMLLLLWRSTDTLLLRL
jgi:hypothetical protein